MHPHLRSRHRRASYDPAAYTPDLLAHWISEGERQAAKDRVLLPRIAALLGPGRVLELGAGAGQLTLLLRERGFDVLASDFAPFFVEHLVSLGPMRGASMPSTSRRPDSGGFRTSSPRASRR